MSYVSREIRTRHVVAPSVLVSIVIVVTHCLVCIYYAARVYCFSAIYCRCI